MSSDNSPPPTPNTANRRTSISRQTLGDLFGRNTGAPAGTPAFPGPIATAAANAQAQQRRRSSITQALSGSPTSTSSFSLSGRGGASSYGSSNSPSGSIEESAIEDGDAPAPSAGSSPSSPFRRVSFGARALKDARAGAGLSNGMNGDGFDWSEHHKNRVARSTSMLQRPAPLGSTPAPPPSSAAAARAMSTAVPEQPVKEMPKKVKHLDEHSERILKGDFVMS